MLSSQEIQTRLSQIPSEKLASALVDIRFMSDAAEAAIERLLAGSEERVRRFEEGLKNALPENRKRFRNRDYVNAEKLEALLMELRDDGIEPSRGFSAILADRHCVRLHLG